MALDRARRVGEMPATQNHLCVWHPHPNPPPQARERGATAVVVCTYGFRISFCTCQFSNSAA
jgi:hypothetical protein